MIVDMRVVIQRVKSASVRVEAENYDSAIGKGLMVLAAFENGDNESDIDWMTRKICALRVFDDGNGVMNLSVRDVNGEVMIVSQFTLYASTSHGNRPSYIRAARPDVSAPLYELFCRKVSEALGQPVARGIFGADMQVSLVNDGPVTIIIDSKTRE